MKYFGGKNRSGKRIATILNEIIEDKNIKNYIELFVGSGGVFKHISCENKIINDKEPLIIALHEYLSKGGKVSLQYEDYYKDVEPLYNKLKRGEYGDLDIGIVGYMAYACSFGGIKFHTFARTKARDTDFFKRGLKNLMEKENYKDTKIYNLDYKNVEIPENSLIYCDPPYKNTIGYSVDFDYEEFENYIYELAKNNIVIVSEYTRLNNTRILFDFDFVRGMRSGKDKKNKKVKELLLIHENCNVTGG